MRKIAIGFVLPLVLWGCSESQQPQRDAPNPSAGIALVDVANSAEEEAEIRSLIDQLVFAEGRANDQPVRNPSMKIFDADGNEVKPAGDPKDAEEKRKRFESCEMAFIKLTDHMIAAFPILIEHLDDQRQSINFRNHYSGNSVGNACYWIIYYQLQDRPESYSEYGHSRLGRDGNQHPKPYWEGTPFDDAGGIKEWLEQNKELSYGKMQIKCLQWLLDRERAIGVPDADSYFLNVLPLEIRILEHRLETGDDVAEQLDELRTALQNRKDTVVPLELLPDK